MTQDRGEGAGRIVRGAGNPAIAAIKVEFDKARALSPKNLGAFNREVNPGALGGEMHFAVMEAVVIITSRSQIHVLGILGGIPVGLQLNKAPQHKISFGEGCCWHR
jgi:hypothetical protein